MPTLTRPMFSEQAQNGGIVSTVSPVQETAPVPRERLIYRAKLTPPWPKK